MVVGESLGPRLAAEWASVSKWARSFPGSWRSWQKGQLDLEHRYSQGHPEGTHLSQGLGEACVQVS